MPKIRVAHIGPSTLPVWFGRGGAIQRRIVELGRAQMRMGDEPLLISPVQGRVVDGHFDVPTAPVSCRMPRPWRDLEFLAGARGAIKAFRPDVVHFHGVPYGAMIVRASVPSILTVDYFRYRASDRLFARRAYEACLRQYAAITVVSDYCRREFTDYWRTAPEAVVVPNGVSLDQFAPDGNAGRATRKALGLSPNASVLLYVGRVCEQKGSDTLADAIPLIREGVPGVEVVVVGPPHQFERSGPSPLIRRLIERGARYQGAVDDAHLRGLYNSCDAFVMPTKEDEMFGMALAEAQACGRPAICSRLGGLVEVASEQSALFFPPSNPAALAQAAVEVLTDPALRREMGAAAVEQSRKFAWPAVASDFRRVYDMSGVGR